MDEILVSSHWHNVGVDLFHFSGETGVRTLDEEGMRDDSHYKFSCSNDFPETGTAKDQKRNGSLPKSMN